MKKRSELNIITAGSTRGIIGILLTASLPLVTTSCSTMKSLFAVDNPSAVQGPISNPFDPQYAQENNHENITLRTKKGDRSVEVEIPANQGEMSDFVVPMSPAFKDQGRAPASIDGSIIDERYLQKRPSISDREITSSLPRPPVEDETRRREVEMGLGVVPAEDTNPESDNSYLAAIDHVKQLYRAARFEAAIMETDDLLRTYPTDPKLYEMRGTLFDRMGKSDLALKAWSQSLRLNPDNAPLKKFVERKQLQYQKRGIASQ